MDAYFFKHDFLFTVVAWALASLCFLLFFYFGTAQLFFVPPTIFIVGIISTNTISIIFPLAYSWIYDQKLKTNLISITYDNFVVMLGSLQFRYTIEGINRSTHVVQE